MNLSSIISTSSYWIGWNVLSILPQRMILGLFDLVAHIAWLKKGPRINQLVLNLSRVLNLNPNDPTLLVIAKNNFRNYLRYYAETFSIHKWKKQYLMEKIIPINTAGIKQALSNGGVVLALPHLGNWDHAGAWAANYFGSVFTIAERLKPESVYQQFLKRREELGISVHALTGDGNPYDFLLRNLESGKLVALLGDRDISGSGMTVDFFGYKTNMPIGPALLALDTGAPLFTCATYYQEDELVIEFSEPIKIEKTDLVGREKLKRAQEVTGLLAKNFEKCIFEHPADWHQMQQIWPDLGVGKK